MGIMGAAMGMGVIFGPAIGGFLGEINPSMPFYFSAALALAVAIFAWIFLPESLTEAARHEARTQEARRSGMAETLEAVRGPLGVVRILAVVVIALLYFSGQISGTLALVLGILAVVFVMTSLMGFCPLYLPLGISTIKKTPK